MKQLIPVLLSALTLSMLFLSSTLPAQTLTPTQGLARSLDSLFNDPSFSNATFGVAIQSLKTGDYLYRLNDAKSLLPASNMKLFTAAEALALLGPEYRYTTKLMRNGGINRGTLGGDLVIFGSGDPTFGSMAFGDSVPTRIFDAWADSVKSLGIKRIDPAVVGDDSYFTDDLYPQGWSSEDLPFYYAMPTTALAFNENQVTVTVSPGPTANSDVRVFVSPDTNDVTVINQGITIADSMAVKTNGGRDALMACPPSTIEIAREIGSNTIRITGSMAKSGAAIIQQVSVDEPTLWAAVELWTKLEERGVKISGVPRTSNRPEVYLDTQLVASYTSPPLSEIVRVMNKESNNLYAEMLFRTVARFVGGEGSWTRGAEVMKRYLASIEIDTTRVAIYDGSGLSRMDLVTAGDEVTLLRAMYENPNTWPPFFNSLPIVGVDGTLKDHLKGTLAEGSVRAKTGSMTGVRSISGYLTTREGEMLAFSILVNNYTAAGTDAGKLEDAALVRLVNFSRAESH